MSKYKSEKIKEDGYTFDSKVEALYYSYLKKNKEKFNIDHVVVHPTFDLIPKNDKFRALKYISDFLIFFNNGTSEIVDIKGMATEGAKIKRKLMYYFWGKEVKWICRSLKFGDTDGWIEYDKLQKIRKKNRKLKK